MSYTINLCNFIVYIISLFTDLLSFVNMLVLIYTKAYYTFLSNIKKNFFDT